MSGHLTVDLLAHFPDGAIPRPEQVALLDRIGSAIAAVGDDDEGPHVFVIEAPPGVGKSHLAMTLARWSGDAYLLTSQKLLQDQYEQEFGDAIQLVKGRENYLCERYPVEARVTTSQGLCRRPRGPACQCPYARAKLAALNGAIFCTNTAYFSRDAGRMRAVSPGGRPSSSRAFSPSNRSPVARSISTISL